MAVLAHLVAQIGVLRKSGDEVVLEEMGTAVPVSSFSAIPLYLFHK